MKEIEDFSETILVPEEGVKAKGEAIAPLKQKDLKKVLISRQAVQLRTRELAKQVGKDFEDKFTCIGVLRGAFVFMADLLREVAEESGKTAVIQFIKAASYEEDKSSNSIKLSFDDFTVEGKEVLVVEDIIDTGVTLKEIKRFFLEDKKAKSVKICSLIDKLERKKIDIKADYLGFEVKKGFLVGMGLDCGERYRNLPFVAEFDTSTIPKKT